MTGTYERVTRGTSYERQWLRWPCRVEKDDIIPLSPRREFRYSMQAAAEMLYDPFEAYFTATRAQGAPHLDLAACGVLSDDDLDAVEPANLSEEGKRHFFSERGCDHSQIVAFSSKWGFLMEGRALRGPGLPGFVTKPVPVWAFRAYATLAWCLNRFTQECRRPYEHRSRMLYRCLWRLLDVEGNPPDSGPAVWVAALPGGQLVPIISSRTIAVSGNPVSPDVALAYRSMIRATDVWHGDWQQHPTPSERAALFFCSVLDTLLGNVGLRLGCTRSESGSLLLQQGFAADTLMEAIFIMIYLDATQTKESRPCSLPGCPRIFYLTRIQATNEARGKATYCSTRCAEKARSEAYRKRYPERVRKQARERKRRERASRKEAEQTGR